MSTDSAKITACVNALRDVIPTDFILVGGAAANMQGHDRVTQDVDILIRDPAILHDRAFLPTPQQPATSSFVQFDWPLVFLSV
jgi:hypothetical protein